MNGSLALRAWQHRWDAALLLKVALGDPARR